MGWTPPPSRKPKAEEARSRSACFSRHLQAPLANKSLNQRQKIENTIFAKQLRLPVAVKEIPLQECQSPSPCVASPVLIHSAQHLRSRLVGSSVLVKASTPQPCWDQCGDGAERDMPSIWELLLEDDSCELAEADANAALADNPWQELLEDLSG